MAKVAKLEEELGKLVAQGDLLYFAMARDLGRLGDDLEKQLKESKIKLPNFKRDYDAWCSKSLRVVAQVLPDRLDDFVALYKVDRRKEADYLTYTLSDYMLGLRTTRGIDVVVDANAGLPKMERQVAILKAAQECFSNVLLDLTEVLQADLFDSELDAASELGKRGFLRGGGAIAGVVLEKHLGHVCDVHGLKLRKKNPTIADFNQLLKDNGIIDTAKWRFIQHLTDLRNLCDHKKDRDPTKDDIAELVEGAGKVVKTVS